MSNAAITRTIHDTHTDYAFEFEGRPALVRKFHGRLGNFTSVWLDSYQITPGNKAQSQEEILRHGRKLWAERA